MRKDIYERMKIMKQDDIKPNYAALAKQLAYALEYFRISLLEMYYKYNAPEFYDVKMHDILS